MPELYPSDAMLLALNGTLTPLQELLHHTMNQSPHYLWLFKLVHQIERAFAQAGALRVYRDGVLTFGVRAGTFANGATTISYVGATAQALTDDATNSIYLTAAGVLTVATDGFPAAATTPHVPLATIVTADGTYADADITDLRGAALAAPLSALTAGLANSLIAKAPSLSITAAAEAGDVRAVTVALLDAAGAPLAARARVRLWIATADFGAPSAAGNTVALTTGTQLRELTANGDYEVISSAAGVVAFNLTVAGDATRYVLAELDGRIYSSGAIAFAA